MLAKKKWVMAGAVLAILVIVLGYVVFRRTKKDPLPNTAELALLRGFDEKFLFYFSGSNSSPQTSQNST